VANHVDIFEFCMFYVVCFTALFSLTPLGEFPPRPITFTIPALTIASVDVYPSTTWSIPWINFMVMLGTSGLLLIIAINLVSNIEVLGSGMSFNGKYLSTIVVGFIFGAGIGTSMIQMMPTDLPLLVSFFLVWVWVILLIYSVVMYAGAGSTG
jgi:phosphatidylglycerophosphate synthase